MAQTRKWNRYQHNLTSQDVEDHEVLVGKPLMIGKEARNKGGCHNGQYDIIGSRSYELDFRGYKPSDKEEDSTANDDDRHKISHTFRQRPPTQIP